MSRMTIGHRRKFTARYLLGDDLTGERATEATFWRDDVTSVTASRWACWAGWKRASVRVTALPIAGASAVSAVQHPAAWGNSLGAIGTVLTARGAVAAGSAIRHRRFRRVYLRPLTRTVRRVIPDARVHIDRQLEGLAPRLARPMSPAEVWLRDLYGRYAQPVLRWAPDRLTRGYWAMHERTEPIRNRASWFRKPAINLPTRVEITVPAGFVTKEQRDIIRQAVIAKLGLSDLVESWDQVGPKAVGTWTIRERPPQKCTIDDIRPALDRLAEWEFVVGITTGGRPVIISLDDDAPHIACSAGSGAGKSVLAMALASQVLARGGRVTILDRKGSHRWARGLAGVTYCTKPADMSARLIHLSQQADDRNEAAMDQPEGWDCGPREFVIFEEMNATVPWLKQWWDTVREKGDPKICPAIVAFRNIMYMGRSAKTNLYGVAQMLTANTTGGPEARENFGVRALARYTANNWKMLAPECPMPRKSKIRGRWQIVIAGEATEVQVVFLTDDQARQLAAVSVSPTIDNRADQAKQMGTAYDGDTAPELLTLREGAQRFCPGIAFETLKKRRDRARRTGGGPKFARIDGRAEKYDPDEFRQWLITESLLPTEPTNV